MLIELKDPEDWVLYRHRRYNKMQTALSDILIRASFHNKTEQCSDDCSYTWQQVLNDHSLTQVKLISDNHSDKGIVFQHERPKTVELYKEAHSGFIGWEISNIKNDIYPTSN